MSANSSKERKERVINHFLAVNFDLTGQDMVIENRDEIEIYDYQDGNEVCIELSNDGEFIGSFTLSESEYEEIIEGRSRDGNGCDERKMLVNMIQTPDGTLLQSCSQHHFVSYEDLNGENFFVDGGLVYRRVGGSGWIDRALYEGDDHEELREHFKWGSYGKEGDKPLEWITLKDMSAGHIEAIIEGGHGAEHVRNLMSDELEWRKGNDV